MLGLLVVALCISAFYSAAVWVFLAIRTYRYGEDWEDMTFRLGLCFILSCGFLLQHFG